MYVVNIVTDTPNRWQETLCPYKDYFKTTYGQVRYQRDGRPIFGFALSQYESQSLENPRGWCPGINESEGFVSAARMIEERFQLCSDRVMLWTPTGYSTNQRANYPFQFASPWSAYVGGVPHPMHEAPAMLRSLASVPGRTLGLWWGHAANPSLGWADDPTYALRTADSSMVNLWFAELQRAVESGATEFGLDAFVHHITPVWDQYELLSEAHRRYPAVRFCTEERSSDIMHTQAATWVDGYRGELVPGLQFSVIEGSFLLADIIVPGHETWVGMQFNRSRNADLWGLRSMSSAQQADVERVRALGYVPVTWVPMNLKQGYSLAR